MDVGDPASLDSAVVTVTAEFVSLMAIAGVFVSPIVSGWSSRRSSRRSSSSSPKSTPTSTLLRLRSGDWFNESFNVPVKVDKQL